MAHVNTLQRQLNPFGAKRVISNLRIRIRILLQDKIHSNCSYSLWRSIQLFSLRLLNLIIPAFSL